MTTYHAIGVPTLTPTLRGARKAWQVAEHCPAKIIASGTLEECFHGIVQIADHSMLLNNVKDWTSEALTVAKTEYWTYHIITDKTSGAPRKEDHTKGWEYTEASIKRMLVEWHDTLIHRIKRFEETIVTRRSDFIEAIDKPDDFTTPSDQLSWTLTEITNFFNNLRLDLLMKYSAELNTARSHLDRKRKSKPAA